MTIYSDSHLEPRHFVQGENRVSSGKPGGNFLFLTFLPVFLYTDDVVCNNNRVGI